MLVFPSSQSPYKSFLCTEQETGEMLFLRYKDCVVVQLSARLLTINLSVQNSGHIHNLISYYSSNKAACSLKKSSLALCNSRASSEEVRRFLASNKLLM